MGDELNNTFAFREESNVGASLESDSDENDQVRTIMYYEFSTYPFLRMRSTTAPFFLGCLFLAKTVNH